LIFKWLTEPRIKQSKHKESSGEITSRAEGRKTGEH